MAESKAEKQADAANKQVQDQVDREEEQGFRGVKVDPRDNAEYTLQTGPDSPGGPADDRTRLEQHGA